LSSIRGWCRSRQYWPLDDVLPVQVGNALQLDAIVDGVVAIRVDEYPSVMTIRHKLVFELVFGSHGVLRELERVIVLGLEGEIIVGVQKAIDVSEVGCVGFAIKVELVPYAVAVRAGVEVV